MPSAVDQPVPKTQEKPSVAFSRQYAADLEAAGGLPSAVVIFQALCWLVVRRKFIGLTTALFLVVGVIISLIIPNRYTSDCRLMPPKQAPSSVSILNSLPSMGSLGEAATSGLSLKDPNAIYIGILESRPVADRLIARFDLQKIFRKRDMTETRKKLKDETRIISENSGLILISVEDKNKRLAADLANAYTEELRNLSKNIAFSEAARRRVFFEDEISRAKENLVSAEAQFAKVQEQKALVRPDAQAMALLSNIAGIRAQIAAKQVELQALRSYSTPQNPDLQIVEQELAALQSAAAKLNRGSDTSDVTDMGLMGMSKGGLDYLRAQRELQYRETFFQLMLKQLEAAKLDEARDAIVIQTVESAIPADRKSSPHRASIAVASLLLGFLCSVLYLRFMESLMRNPVAMESWIRLRDSMSNVSGRSRRTHQ
jgi:tyrosine-protein kinase Etk/Wzc